MGHGTVLVVTVNACFSILIFILVRNCPPRSLTTFHAPEAVFPCPLFENSGSKPCLSYRYSHLHGSIVHLASL
jgi:hypothetical protein